MSMEGVKLVTRKAWRARRPKRTVALPVDQARGVAVHYSGMNADEQAKHRNCAARVRAIQRFHMETRGWFDIAYSWVVCKHGFVFRGRGIGKRTAANGTAAANDRYYAVCFLGDDTKGRDDVTDAGRQALVGVLRFVDRQIPARMRVRPHSDFVATGCPGTELRAFIARRPWARQ